MPPPDLSVSAVDHPPSPSPLSRPYPRPNFMEYTLTIPIEKGPRPIYGTLVPPTSLLCRYVSILSLREMIYGNASRGVVTARIIPRGLSTGWRVREERRISVFEIIKMRKMLLREVKFKRANY